MFTRRNALATLAFVGVVAAQRECIVPHEEGRDDSPDILKTFQECRENSVIRFQQVNYTAYTPMTWDNLSICYSHSVINN